MPTYVLTDKCDGCIRPGDWRLNGLEGALRSDDQF